MITITVKNGSLSRSGAVTGKAAPDEATASWNGLEFQTKSRHGATMKLAREMAAANCPDQAWQAVGENGRRRFFGQSLHALAKLTMTEGDKTALHTVPWTNRFPALSPDPDSE